VNFSDLGIDADLVEALASKSIIEPFPIQEQTIPIALTGQDIIGQAKTGTGKTFGFGLPLIQRLGLDPEPGVKALIVVPTRELAVQVIQEILAVILVEVHQHLHIAVGREAVPLLLQGGTELLVIEYLAVADEH